MDIDLSCKSICELRFDRSQVSNEEVLVASRVQSLNVSNNRIVHIVGLGSLFCRLAVLDLAHNNLGSGVGPKVCAWMNDLPSSLRVLNLAHNGLNAFVSTDKRECVSDETHSRNGCGPSLAEVAGTIETALERLCRACPLTLALFFNRARFPHLCELDLSYNLLCMTLDESDAIEEMWQGTVECLSASFELQGHDHAMWLKSTTSSVTVLRLDGNKHLSALNGMLWGMEAVTHLCAANIGVEDLTAISAAATLCPKLHSLDMHGSPVVDIFLHAPRHTLSTFAEMLLLPEILDGGKGDNDDEEQIKEEETTGRDALQRILREVVQKHLEDIEAAVSRQGNYGDGGLARVLYAVLIQQVIPQVVEVDGSVDVNAARRRFTDAARDVVRQLIDKNNRVTTAKKNGTTSPHKFAADINSSLVKQQAREKEGPQSLDVSRGGADGSSFTSLNQSHSVISSARKGCGVFSPSGGSASGSIVGYDKSRSAQGMMTKAAATAAAAAAAASVQLRPAVLVTNCTATTSSILASPTASVNHNTNNINNSKANRVSESEIATGLTSASKSTNGGRGSGGGRVHNENDQMLLGEREKKLGNGVHSVAVDIEHVQSDCSSFSEERSRGSRFQRALAALTPMLEHRLRTERMAEQSSVANSYGSCSRDEHETSAVSTMTSTTNTSGARELLTQQAQFLEKALLESQDRQRNMQETVFKLKEQLRQDRLLITDQRKEAARLRQELDLLVEENRCTTRKLKKRQKEIAYGAAALRRREAVAQRKSALEYIEQEEKALQQAERRLREKVALSGVCSRLHHTDPSGVIGVTAVSGTETRPPRKTRADLLREKAVQERIEEVRRGNPLAYNSRKFRIGEYNTTNGEQNSSLSTNGVADAAAFQHVFQEGLIRQSRGVVNGPDSGDRRVHEKTPGPKGRGVSASTRRSTTTALDKEEEEEEEVVVVQSLYDKGYSPYGNDINDHADNDDVHDYAGSGGDKHGRGYDDSQQWLQQLSLQQLFEEAAAIRQRQNILQQRMRDAACSSGSGSGNNSISSNSSGDIVIDLCAKEHDKRGMVVNKDVYHDNNNNGNNNNSVGALFGKYGLSTCIEMIEQAGAATSNTTAFDYSWGGLNSANTENKKEDNNDDDDEDLVDVTVSVADRQLNRDFFVATVPPLLDYEGELIEPVQNQGRSPQQSRRDGSVSLPSSPCIIEEHISMDARSIYEEILRQQQEQLKKQEKQSQEVQLQQRLAHVQTVCTEIEGVSSSVSVAIKNSSCNGEGNSWNTEEEFEESRVSNLHDNGEDDNGVDNSTRRVLFARGC